MAQNLRARESDHMVSDTSSINTIVSANDAPDSDRLPLGANQTLGDTYRWKPQSRRNIVRLAADLSATILLTQLQVLFHEKQYDAMSHVIDRTRKIADHTQDDLTKAKCDVWAGIVHFENSCVQSAVQSFIAACPIISDCGCVEADILPYYIRKLRAPLEAFSKDCNDDGDKNDFLRQIEELILRCDKRKHDSISDCGTDSGISSSNRSANEFMLDDQLSDDEFSENRSTNGPFSYDSFPIGKAGSDQSSRRTLSMIQSLHHEDVDREYMIDRLLYTRPTEEGGSDGSSQDGFPTAQSPETAHDLMNDPLLSPRIKAMLDQNTLSEIMLPSDLDFNAAAPDISFEDHRRSSDNSDVTATTSRKGSDPNFKSLGTVIRDRLREPTRLRVLHSLQEDKQDAVGKADITSGAPMLTKDRSLAANTNSERSSEHQDENLTADAGRLLVSSDDGELSTPRASPRRTTFQHELERAANARATRISRFNRLFQENSNPTPGLDKRLTSFMEAAKVSKPVYDILQPVDTLVAGTGAAESLKSDSSTNLSSLSKKQRLEELDENEKCVAPVDTATQLGDSQARKDAYSHPARPEPCSATTSKSSRSGKMKSNLSQGPRGTKSHLSSISTIPPTVSETLKDANDMMSMDDFDSYVRGSIVSDISTTPSTTVQRAQDELRTEITGLLHTSGRLPSSSTSVQTSPTSPIASELSNALVLNRILDRVKTINGKIASDNIIAKPLTLITTSDVVKCRRSMAQTLSRSPFTSPSTPSPLRQTFSLGELPDGLAKTK